MCQACRILYRSWRARLSVLNHDCALTAETSLCSCVDLGVTAAQNDRLAYSPVAPHAGIVAHADLATCANSVNYANTRM